MTTRAQFLERIRAEVRRAGHAGGTRAAGSVPRTGPGGPGDRGMAVRASEGAARIERPAVARTPDVLERFRQEFERVAGVLHRVRSIDEVPGVVAGIARARAGSRVVAWHGTAIGAELEAGLRNAGLVVDVAPHAEVSEDERRGVRAAAATADLGLTGVDLAIAETGTLVLRSGAGRPRSTSLLPPTHVAVFDASVLVETLAELGTFLEAWHADGADGGAMINLITGPSRTADIELTLTRGVHGPREMHAIFVEHRLRG